MNDTIKTNFYYDAYFDYNMVDPDGSLSIMVNKKKISNDELLTEYDDEEYFECPNVEIAEKICNEFNKLKTNDILNFYEIRDNNINKFENKTNNIKFADTLKNTLSDLFKISREELEDWKENVTINGIITRQLMLNLGTDVVRYGTNKENHNIINKYLNKEIDKEVFEKKLFETFLLHIPQENNKLIFKDKNSDKIIKEININDFKKQYIDYMYKFIDNHKEVLLSDLDTWSAMVLENIPKNERSFITDGRFDAEFQTLFQDKEIKDRTYVMLHILLDTNTNTDHPVFLPMIKNKGKRIDSEYLFNIYNKSNSLDDFYKKLNKEIGIAPAEYINIAYTLEYFNEKIYKNPESKLDKIIKETELYKKTTPLAFKFGLTQEELLENENFNKMFKDILNKKIKNPIFLHYGPSENGKDFTQNLIDNLTIKISNISEIKLNNQMKLSYSSPTIKLEKDSSNLLKIINNSLNNINYDELKNRTIKDIFKKNIEKSIQTRNYDKIIEKERIFH